jgi:hypothetical protein
MSQLPELEIVPEINKWPKRIFIGVIVFFLVSGGLYFGIKAIIDSGITKGPDHMFGDQHLKTSVALIELHKTRYGKYPESIADLRFLGGWDKIHTGSVLYIPSQDLLSYYVEVERGWVGKPKNLIMPQEFWQGTGFNPLLKNKYALTSP